MSLLCERSISWGFESRINSSELTEVNYLFFKIACHNIFLISHIDTIPLDKFAFLYAFITDGSMCFPSLFIETIVEVYRSKSKAYNLFFPIFINRVLLFLGLDSFPYLELVHITAPVGATFLRQRQAQLKSAKPSSGTSKRPRGEASTTASTSGGQLAAEEIHVNPIAYPTVALPLSLRAIMETFMTTQTTHG